MVATGPYQASEPLPEGQNRGRESVQSKWVEAVFLKTLQSSGDDRFCRDLERQLVDDD